MMYPHLGDVGDLAQPMEHAVDIAWFEEAAVCGGEDEAGVAPLSAPADLGRENARVQPDSGSAGVVTAAPRVTSVNAYVPLIQHAVEPGDVGTVVSQAHSWSPDDEGVRWH